MTDTTAFRAALSEGYLGDTKNFHSMFAAPQTLDLRIQNLLTGFAQQTDAATADDLAMAANLRAIAKALHDTNQATRIQLVANLKAALDYPQHKRIGYRATDESAPNFSAINALSLGGSLSSAINNFHVIRTSQYTWNISIYTGFDTAAAYSATVFYEAMVDSTSNPLLFEFVSQVQAAQVAAMSSRIPFGPVCLDLTGSIFHGCFYAGSIDGTTKRLGVMPFKGTLEGHNWTIGVKPDFSLSTSLDLTPP